MASGITKLLTNGTEDFNHYKPLENLEITQNLDNGDKDIRIAVNRILLKKDITVSANTIFLVATESVRCYGNLKCKYLVVITPNSFIDSSCNPQGSFRSWSFPNTRAFLKSFPITKLYLLCENEKNEISEKKSSTK